MIYVVMAIVGAVVGTWIGCLIGRHWPLKVGGR